MISHWKMINFIEFLPSPTLNLSSPSLALPTTIVFHFLQSHPPHPPHPNPHPHPHHHNTTSQPLLLTHPLPWFSFVCLGLDYQRGRCAKQVLLIQCGWIEGSGGRWLGLARAGWWRASRAHRGGRWCLVRQIGVICGSTRPAARWNYILWVERERGGRQNKRDMERAGVVYKIWLGVESWSVLDMDIKQWIIHDIYWYIILFIWFWIYPTLFWRIKRKRNQNGCG